MAVRLSRTTWRLMTKVAATCLTFTGISLFAMVFSLNRYHQPLFSNGHVYMSMRGLADVNVWRGHLTVETATANRPRPNGQDETAQQPLLNAVYLKQPSLSGNKTCYGNTCRPDQFDWTMVTFVKSAANHTRHRRLLRQTWGSVRHVAGGRFALVFVVGRTSSVQHQWDVDEEHARFGDILQYNGSDDYRNIAYKTLAGMQWASEHLPPHYYYSSSDDDFMVDMGLLQEVVDANSARANTSDWPEFPIVCTHRRIQGWRPVRDPNSRYAKWLVSRKEYKWPVYPTSCLGGMYTTSVGVIAQLWRLCRRERPLSTDDVWITGVIREKLGLPGEMVVSTPGGDAFIGGRKVATHYESFAKVSNERVLDDWRDVFDSFERKSHCFCW